MTFSTALFSIRCVETMMSVDGSREANLMVTAGGFSLSNLIGSLDVICERKSSVSNDSPTPLQKIFKSDDTCTCETTNVILVIFKWELPFVDEIYKHHFS